MRNLNLSKVMILLLVVSATGLNIKAQTGDKAKQAISFTEFLSTVSKNNVSYIAEKYNVKIAEAEAISAKVFPDPELSIEGFHNGKAIQKDTLGYGGAIGLTYTFELGGKRRSRIRLAKSEAGLAKIELEQFYQDLRADATDSYLEAMKQEELMALKRSSYESMIQLHKMDSIRFKLGEINKNDLRQSRIEVVSLYNELLAQEAEYKSSLVELNTMMGYSADSILFTPKAEWLKEDKEYILPELYSLAFDNNKDLQAAQKGTEIAINELKVARSEKWIDLELSVGYEMNSEVLNPGAEAIAFNGVTAGISIPLKFSNFNRGTMLAAKYGVEQSKAEKRSTNLEVKAEVTKAFFAYEAAKKQLDQFKGGIIDDSRKLLEGVTYQYQRGETSLFELLMAKHTCNEMEEMYIEALKEYAASLVELETTCGIWDINF